MPLATSCRTADFFVLRTPSLPVDALTPPPAVGGEMGPAGGAEKNLSASREQLRGALKELVRNPAIREALVLASPDLATRIAPWLEGLLEGGAAERVERALLRYLIRMSHRSTPFGLFASVSTGTWKPASRLSVASWSACRKAVRLDWGALEELLDRLARRPRTRAALRYRVNSSLHACAGWHRYLERRDDPGQERSYHLEAVEASFHLDFILKAADGGASLEALAEGLAQFTRVKVDVARTYLDRLVDTQVLCGDLHPPLTSPDPLGQVAQTLGAHPETFADAEALGALQAELRAIQAAPVGAHPEGYVPHLPSLQRLEVAPDRRDLVQVDLFRPAPDLALSPAVRQALEAGAETLRRLSPSPGDQALDRFREAFRDRYESRWVRLLDVLDEESGIGFDGAPTADGSLLKNLPFPSPPPPQQLTPRDSYLLSRMASWQGARTWNLTNADVAALATPDPQPFPNSFAALATLSATDPAALDRGDFSFWMEQYSGASAARWLGRFASGDPALATALQEHLRREEAIRPEVIFAEVIHIPEGRMGNVLARPALRDHEIPFLATPGVPSERAIQPSDLLVTVRGGRVCLRSARTGRDIAPRLSSAHNFRRGPAVYRFLAHLQDQDGRPGGWSWGLLAGLPFLPRLVHGRHVLSKARWKIEGQELDAALLEASGSPWGAFQLLRARRGLPRRVVLTDADYRLLVDLDQPAWVETLHHLVGHRPSFLLTEAFPDPDEALVTSPEGRFTHELVIPFESAVPVSHEPAPAPPVVNGGGPRAYPPGSEWLYLKLYCGPASADRMLTELEPLLRMAQKQGLWDRWHFVRYRDPLPHLRLRFHGLPFRLLAEWLPLLRKHLEPYQAQGLLWKWQVDTFEPELERYGGHTGFGLAEAWFFGDSQHALHQLMASTDPDRRWKAGLKGVDAIWAALGLDLHERKALALTARDSFRKEWGLPGQGANPIGAKFRELRRELESGFPHPTGGATLPNLAGLPRLREAHREGLIQEDLGRIAASLTHMHLNRLLRTHHRESEWVLMEFLTRLYESALARQPEAEQVRG